MGTNQPEHGPSSSSKYVLDLQRRLNWAHKVARKQMEKEALKAKKYYDRRVRCSQLSTGDLVLVKRMAFKGKHKIQDRWKQDVYEVLGTCRGSPLVFQVQKEDGTGKIRILHRNLLLPLRTKIPEEDLEDSPYKPPVEAKLLNLRNQYRMNQKLIQQWYKNLRKLLIMMNQVCLQDPGQEAKVHHQHWLVLLLFLNVL